MTDSRTTERGSVSDALLAELIGEFNDPFCKRDDCHNCKVVAALRELQRLRSSPEPSGIPAVLFDGFAVFKALDDNARKRTGTENVSDVLDAVVRLLRGPALDEAGRVAPEPPAKRLPVITVKILADLIGEGFFEKTDEPVKGVKGVSWSQAAVDFACMIGCPVVPDEPTPSTKTEKPNPDACLHVWKVEGVRNPSPDQQCDRGCGYTWAQRCADENAVDCRWPDGCRLAGVCSREGVCHGRLALNGSGKP
jgi:hypothetical protein